MPARTFEDSAGVIWEVFEVHRSSQKSGAVSAGLEAGWLTFVSGDSKRRLAPFPSGWLTAEPQELERLCGTARIVRAAGLPVRARARDAAAAAAPQPPRVSAPRIRTRAALPDGQSVGEPAASANPTERTVREFAHEARARGLPAIGAMIELKGLLARMYPESDSPARDVRSVRRWFVESYYFERDGETSGDGSPRDDDQSR